MTSHGRFPGIRRGLLITTVQAYPPARIQLLRHMAWIRYVIIQ